MIRRLFWLVLGAVLGITGYRRLTALARSVSPGAALRGLSRFAADVRDGMDMYMERQPGDPASTLDSHGGRKQLSGPPAGRARYGTDHTKDGS
jgi:hypothetical protein